MSAQTISGVAVTGDRARVDARRIEVHRSSAAADLTGRLNNLPRPPVRLFVGRDSDLARLDALIGAGPGVISQAVHGLGGVGKSELALQYAHAHRDHYQVRWWVNCETEDTLVASLAELTARVNADLLLTATAVEAAEWAAGWLQNRSSWLLILDNVERLPDVEGLLGRLDTGHILITTRRDLDWGRLVDGSLRLGLLDRESAVELLVSRSGQPDVLSAAVLADELGYLPLALQQAASFLRQTQTPLATYLDRVRAQPEQVLATIAEGDPAERAVAQVWLETLNRLAEERPEAIDLLRLLACLAPDDVPRSVLTADADDDLAVDQALSVLASYSLIALSGQTVSMHRLLQVVVRAQTRRASSAAGNDAAELDSWRDTLDRAVDRLNSARPVGNPSEAVDTWPEWRSLAPHVEVLAQLVDPTAGLEFAQLAGQAAFFYWTQARYDVALRLQRHALAITEAVLPESHRELAIRLSNLGTTLDTLGHAAEALPLAQRALAIGEATLPTDHPAIAVYLDNVALTLGRLDRSEEALPLQRRALAISEADSPQDHRAVATRLNNLASTLDDLGRSSEALPLRQRALEIAEATFSEDHPDIALMSDNLAFTLVQVGRFTEALSLNRRALAISEAMLDRDHPDISIRLNNIAFTLGKLNRSAEALPLRQRALAISESALPEGHPDIAIRLDNLAFTLSELDRAGEALPLRERALAISEAALTPGHPTIALRLRNLAATLDDLGRSDEASVLRERAERIRSE